MKKHYCHQCGAALADGQLYCFQCGTAVDLSQQQAPKKSNLGKVIIALVCCIVLLITGTIGAVVLLRKKPAAESTADTYVAMDSGFGDIAVTDESTALEAVKSVADVLGIRDAENELKLTDTQTVDTTTYYRYQQYYQSIPVEGKCLTLAADNGKATALTSSFVPDLAVASSAKSASPTAITDAVKKHLQRQISKDITIVLIAEASDANRVVYLTAEPVIAYRIDVITDSGAFTYFVDASTADVIDYTEAADYVQTAFTIDGQNGKQSFTAESDGTTKTMKHISATGTEITVATPKQDHIFDWFVGGNADIVTWTDDNKVNQSAVDMLTNVTNTYYFYLNTFKRDSLDGKGGPLNLYVNTEGYRDYENNDNEKTNNAYFYNSPAGPIITSTKNYDNGKSINEFSANLDVMAHEYTHGVIHFTCGLRDSGLNHQPGALNEGIADVFGILVEQTITGWEEPDWVMENGMRDLRNLSWQSTKHPYPATVEELNNAATTRNGKGELRYYTNDKETATSDYCHFASSVISHTAYTMWNGVDGTAAKKIDEHTLAKLWYNALFLMQPDSTFSNFRTAVEMSGKIMLKNKRLSPEQYQCITESFDAAGITPSEYTYGKTVKNSFDVTVLNANGNENVIYDYALYKTSQDIREVIKKNEADAVLVQEKKFVTAKTHFDLADGTYQLVIRENGAAAEKEPVICKMVVNGQNAASEAEVTINTDFDDVIGVILNDTTEASTTAPTTTTAPSTTETTTKASESDLRAKADKDIGNVALFEYHDYDHNGTKEAFFVSAAIDNEMGGSEGTWKVYFISAEGKIELMYTETEWSFYDDETKKYYEAADAQGFFCYSKGGFGSGWLTDVYSVKDGKPKMLSISGTEGFYQKDDGTFYTLRNEFKEGGGHLYPEYELIYDSKNCDFSTGSKISDGEDY